MRTVDKVAALRAAGVPVETYGDSSYVTIDGSRYPAERCCEHAGCGALGSVRVVAYAFCPAHAAEVQAEAQS